METSEFVPEEKPRGLKVLCVLTFIYTCFFGFFSLLGLVFAKPLMNFMAKLYTQMEEAPEVKEEQLQQMRQLLELGTVKFSLYCGVGLLLFATSFYGALQMWNLKYKGFIFYAIANGVLLISNSVQMNIFGVIMDALFLGLYFWQSKALKK